MNNLRQLKKNLDLQYGEHLMSLRYQQEFDRLNCLIQDLANSFQLYN